MKLAKLIFSLLFTVIGWIASAVTLWQIYWKETVSASFLFFCGVIIIVSILYVAIQVRMYVHDKKRVFTHSSSEKVHKYLYDWIKNGGRTVIFTRDFTWANCTQDMLKLLQDKAKKNGLIICLYKATTITDDLKKRGAEIYIHNQHNLKTRFTIIHYGTNYPQITVGSRTPDGLYVNERYDRQSYPNVYNTFLELFESTKAAAQK